MNVRITIGRNVIIYGEGSIPLPPGNESGSVLIANSATPGDASFKTLEDAGIAKKDDLVQLAGKDDLVQLAGDLYQGENIVSDFKGAYINSLGTITQGNINSFKLVIFPVVEGEIYYIISDRDNIYNAFMVDENTQQSRFSTVVGVNKITIPEGCHYLAVNVEFTPQGQPKYGDWRKQAILSARGDKLLIFDGLDTVNDINNRMPSMIRKNLFDDKAYLDDRYVSSTTHMITIGRSWQCAAVEVQPNTTYTLSGVKHREGIAIYDSDPRAGGVSGTQYWDGSTLPFTFTTSENTKYVAFNLKSDVSEDWSDIQLEVGSVPTPYSRAYVVKKSDVEGIHELEERIDSILKTKGFSYEFFDNNLNLSYDNGDSLTVLVDNRRGYAGNDMFNFVSHKFKGVSTLNGDDVAPTHSQNTTIGANHGQYIRRLTVASHGLTNVDIGTEWIASNGVKVYIMRILDINRFDVLGENVGTAYSASFSTIPSTGTITRNSEVLQYTSVSAQLYPSINNLSLRVLENGKDIITGGKGIAKFIDIVESYDIMNISEVLDNIIRRVGSSEAPIYTGSSTLRIENNYRILDNMTIIVMTTVKANQPVEFRDIMATQARLIGEDGVSKYYVPNSLPVTSALDFRKPLSVTWNASLPPIFFDSSTWADVNNPPDRIVVYYNHIAFTIGILPTRGVGKNLQNFTDRTFELRNNTGKIYPHPVEGTKVGNPIPTNSLFSMIMYRSFSDLSKTRSGNRMSFFNFTLDHEEYVIIDYPGTMEDRIDLEKEELNGKEITVIQEVNTALLSDTYNSGFYLRANYVEGETCFAMLCIK